MVYGSPQLTEGYSSKIHPLRNLYDAKQANYMSELDHTLIRMRNQVTSDHENLNFRLNKLKFEAKRIKEIRDEEKRELDKSIYQFQTKDQYNM